MYLDRLKDSTVGVLNDFFEDQYHVDPEDYYGEEIPNTSRDVSAEIARVCKNASKHTLAITNPEQKWMERPLIRNGFRQVVKFMGTHGYALKLFIKTKKTGAKIKNQTWDIDYYDFPSCCGASLIEDLYNNLDESPYEGSVGNEFNEKTLQINNLVVTVIEDDKKKERLARKLGMKKVRGAPVWYKAKREVK